MSSLEKAVETQLQNIQTKAGRNLEELTAVVKNSGLTKHGELREMMMREFGLGYGDANTIVHYALQSDGERAAAANALSGDEIIDEIYSGAKASLRPIHEHLMEALRGFGSFEIVPKKGYVSLRRKKQFAMIGPAAKARLEVGLNMKGAEPDARLIEQPPGGMCGYKVYLTTVNEVDADLLAWLRRAYDSAS